MKIPRGYTAKQIVALARELRPPDARANNGGPRPGAGRPKSSAPRCACGAMTLARAEARRHKCG